MIAQNKTPILQAMGITKQFPGVKALDNVDLTLYPGTIHALIGENGAGKSSLMKILAGIQPADQGEILLEGQKVDINHVNDATNLGIALIHQELSLSDNLDIAANVFLGREHLKFGPLKIIDKKSLFENTKQILQQLDLNVSPDTLVKDLSIGQQQMVEIARALSINTKILILDEPTSSLTLKETQVLFNVLNDLKAKGVSIVYISHRLMEIEQIADNVIGLRDGKNSDTLQREDINHNKMVSLMVGRDIDNFYQHANHTLQHPIFEVKEFVTQLHPAHKINFSIQKGEIVSMAGLIGAGRSEIARAIFGIDKLVQGTLGINGKTTTIKSPQDAIRAGIALIPEDRKNQGLVLEMSVENNMTLATLKQNQTASLMHLNKMHSIARDLVQKLNVKTPNLDQQVQFLSGGNQQKIVIGKWLTHSLNLLILDEPTRGVDVMAKEEIYRLMEKFTQQGMAILMISSELEEVIAFSDRVLVVHEGRLAGELSGEDITEKQIMRLATGSAS